MVLLVLAGLLLMKLGLAELDVRPEVSRLTELVQASQALLADLVYLGAAIFFLLTLESRWKRRKVLRATRELRSMAPIVDMHQLTKDPESVTEVPSRD